MKKKSGESLITTCTKKWLFSGVIPLPLNFILGQPPRDRRNLFIKNTTCIIFVFSLLGFQVSANDSSHNIRGFERPDNNATKQAVDWRTGMRALFFLPRHALAATFYPLIQFSEWAEENRIVAHTEDFLYNDSRTFGVLPILSFSTSAGTSAGLKLVYSDFFGRNEKLVAKARYGEEHNFAYELGLQLRQLGHSFYYLQSKIRHESRPNQRFFGVGFSANNHASQSNLNPRASNTESRFSQNRNLILLRGGRYWGESKKPWLRLGVGVAHNQREFSAKANARNNEPSIETVYDTALLTGFNDGSVKTTEFFVESRFDFTDHAGQPASGGTLEGFVGGAPVGQYNYWHYGLEATKYFNLYYGNRVLMLRAALDAVEGSNARLPFSSLPAAGGSGRLRGYRSNSFRDKKLGLLTIEYHYPIHHVVLGQIFFDAVSLAEGYGKLGEQWKQGYGFGFLFGSKEDLKFKIDFSYGDEYIILLSTDVSRAFRKWSERF